MLSDDPIVGAYYDALVEGRGRVLPSEAAAQVGTRFGLNATDVMTLVALEHRSMRGRGGRK